MCRIYDLLWGAFLKSLMNACSAPDALGTGCKISIIFFSFSQQNMILVIANIHRHQFSCCHNKIYLALYSVHGDAHNKSIQ